MTTVVLAEKPSQARDIARALGVKASHDGYIDTVKGWKVTYAIGHLLELVQPEEYNPAWGGRWSWEQLPMIPQQWKRTPVKKTFKQLKVIKSLLADAKTVVIATDAGREGELIGREILEYCRFKGDVKRFWTSLLTPDAIKTALDNLLPGSHTYPLYEAAMARSHSDWLLGIPGTRAATLGAKSYRNYFPVGRVQTPTLAMVVRRDLEIAGFGAKKYYELEATVKTAKGASLVLKHSPAEENRISDKKVAQALMDKAAKATGPLRVVKSKEHESAPLPYSLPMLQKDANRVFGFSAKRTLELAQALYETKKVASYPRTDCPYLGQSQIPEVPGVLDAVAKTFPDRVAALRKMGVVTRASTFNDSQLTDHHGIIPTNVAVGLEGAELQLYTLIAHRYLQALAPDCKFNSTKVSMDANGVPFKASGKEVTDMGWTQFKVSAKGESDE